VHIPGGNGARPVQEPIRKGRFPMINMGDNAEISYMCRVHLLLRGADCEVRNGF